MSMILDESRCTKAVYRDGNIDVQYADGKSVCFPITANLRLRGQPEEKLTHIEISQFGIHWPELDEDLSHAGLRAGRFGVS
jgi:hypothetical protein